MELLIVIAVIAVLVAVAVPTFTAQTEKAREATDLANIRNAYAEVMNKVLTEGETEYSIEVPLEQAKDGWITEDAENALDNLGEVEGEPVEGGKATVQWADGKLKIIFDGEASGGSTTRTSKYGSYEEAMATGNNAYAQDYIGFLFEGILQEELAENPYPACRKLFDKDNNLIGYYIAPLDSGSSYTHGGKNIMEILKEKDSTVKYIKTDYGDNVLSCYNPGKSDRIMYDSTGKYMGVAIAEKGSEIFHFYPAGSETAYDVTVTSDWNTKMEDLYKAVEKYTK